MLYANFFNIYGSVLYFVSGIHWGSVAPSDKRALLLGVVVHAYNSSTQKSETRRSWAQGHPGLHREALSQKIRWGRLLLIQS
jgi:hypothetical protein